MELSESFAKSAGDGDFSNLPEFEQHREAALKAIDLYDRKIAECVSLLSDSDRTPALREAIREALNAKEALIHRILKTDLTIISRIEIQRNQLMQEMTTAQKAKERISKFKSSWIPESGAELDEKA